MTTTATRRIKTTAKEIPAQLQELARETYKANLAKNEASKEEAKTRKALFAGMKDAGLIGFDAVAVVDGKRVSLTAKIETPERVEVDVRALRKLVSEEDFLAIVGATQTAVKEVAGEATLRRCSITNPGTENVTVKPTK